MGIIMPVCEGKMSRYMLLQVFVDVTKEVRSRIEKGFLSSAYTGHLHHSDVSSSLQHLH